MERCLIVFILLCLALYISLEENNGQVNASYKRTPRDLSRGATTKDIFTPSPTTTSSGEPQYPGKFVHYDDVADPKYDINKLKKLSPLTDICTEEGEVNSDTTKDSCCLPCKCDSVCKKREIVATSAITREICVICLMWTKKALTSKHLFGITCMTAV